MLTTGCDACCGCGLKKIAIAAVIPNAPASTTIATTYTGPQVTYSAGAARTIIFIDPPLVTTQGLKVITANDFDPPGTID